MITPPSASRASIIPYIAFSKESHIPFYQQIYNGYRDLILSGLMRPGQRLPSTRALAKELDVSRLPVVSAFDQLLHEGYLVGRVGSGAYVLESIPDEVARPATGSGIPIHRRDQQQENSSALHKLPNAFRVSLPALDEFPHALWARLVSKHAREASMEMMSYNGPRGLYCLRSAIASYLRTARR